MHAILPSRPLAGSPVEGDNWRARLGEFLAEAKIAALRARIKDLEAANRNLKDRNAWLEDHFKRKSS